MQKPLPQEEEVQAPDNQQQIEVEVLKVENLPVEKPGYLIYVKIESPISLEAKESNE